MGPASYITIIVITKLINPLHENLLCNCHTNRLRYETMHHPFLFFFEQSHIIHNHGFYVRVERESSNWT